QQGTSYSSTWYLLAQDCSFFHHGRCRACRYQHCCLGVILLRTLGCGVGNYTAAVKDRWSSLLLNREVKIILSLALNPSQTAPMADDFSLFSQKLDQVRRIR